MIRYADDLVILCRPGEGGPFRERLARWLKARGLVLNESKTRVLNSREKGFEFLGFAFRWQRSRKGGSRTLIGLTPFQSAGFCLLYTLNSSAIRQCVQQRTRLVLSPF
jgi:hypothetical protein